MSQRRAVKRARPRADSPRPSFNYHRTRSSKPAAPGTIPPDSGSLVNPREYVAGDTASLSVEARENRYNDSLCIICTGESSDSVYHTHFSSSDLRTFALVYAKKENFMCPICKTLEPVRPDEKASRRVVLTTSTLYGIWDQPKLPDNLEHFEIEAIVGGRVRDLTTALKASFLFLPQRLEIIVVAGLNNIGEGQPPEEIVKEMLDMKEMVRQHSMKHQHSPPSYVAFCTILLPPKFCSLYIPDNAPNLAEWVPGNRFVDRYKNLEIVNKRIKEMNL